MLLSVVRSLKIILAATITLHTISCTIAHTKQDHSMQYPADNLKDDHYQPGDNWQLVWSDEFTSKQLESKTWNKQVVEAGQFNEEWQRYTDDEKNAYIDHNCLVIKAIHEGEKHGENKYSSARLNTAGKQSWRYGKIAARVQLPYGKGLWPAFWMLGANCDENGGDTPWPFCGEIDIYEMYGSKDDGAVEANIHYANLSGKHAMNNPSETFTLATGKFSEAFHVFEIEWDEEKITWLVDGKPYAQSIISDEEFNEFHREFFILFNIAVGGTWAGRPDESNVFPQYMYVDWVRVYKQDKL
jgi:beta-glucanase (GH16 family)